MKAFQINGRKIGASFPPYVIAEMSANHNGNLNNAIRLLEEAKVAGADAVKMQTYTADTMTINSNKPEFIIKGGLWDGRQLYDLYSQAHTPWDWHKPLFEKAKELNITIFSTPFDHSAVDFLEELNVPVYKIASFECIDLPLIKYVAKTGKPMIISTGMADENEIEEAVNCAKDNGCKDLILLHCVSGYPADPLDYNLLTIPDMREKFGCEVGLSDHTLSNSTAIASVALGASVIEKHFTLDRNGGGPDDSFSIEKDDLSKLCDDSLSVWKSLGSVNYERKRGEKENLIFRRSLYAVDVIQEGECFTNKNIKSIRPGYGLPPKYLETILGKRARCRIDFGEALTEEMINFNEF